SVIGTTHAVVVGVRQTYFQTAAAANDPPKITYRFSKGEQHDGPVTVIVVMGESINGVRMGLYGFDRDTSPEMKKFVAALPSGFALTHKLGFSSGTATLASVPMFFKIPYYPVALGRSPVNLLGIARDNGFKNYYFSTQFAQSLEVANGRQLVDKIETLDTQAARIAQIRDDVLIENMETLLPRDEKRRFIFLHQRVNHTPYLENCDHLDKTLHTLTTTGTSRNALRANDYDNGMRCYDRSLKRIFDFASKQPGKVYVFVTADHNEAMGEHEEIWGHGSAHLYITLVPKMLFTNDPDGAIAKAFAALKFPTAFEMAALVARTLGTGVTVDGYDPQRFFANSTLPFAYAGFMDVTRRADGSFLSVRKTRAGKVIGEDVLRLPPVAYQYQ
ncbi:MAG: sulfatase-like hydrolase/transferase, partial [Beijerinckiaceae bacterium]